MLTAEELRQLIPAAKQGDSLAMERLCKGFQPLVFMLCRRQSLYNILGEDAENTVWVLFLEAVANFDKKAFETFPGFARKHIINRLMNIFKHSSYRYQKETLSSLEDDSEACQVPSTDDVQALLTRIAVAQEIGQLPQQQAYVLQQYYCQGIPLEDIAAAMNISPRTVRYHRQKALSCLRRCM